MRAALLLALLGLACESKPPPRPPPSPNAVKVAFDSEPRGAVVIVDGASVGLTPVEAPVEPGQHRVSLSLSGYLTYQTDIRIGAGSPQSYKASLIASH